jgi:branched-chain amino acid transport system substrate-binding protein
MRGALGLAAICAIAAVASGCSWLASTDDCHVDADCAARGAAFVKATCSEGLCVVEPGACASNAECGGGDVCNAATHRCATVLSEDCTNPVGDYTPDDAFVVGVIVELTPPLYSAPSIRDAIELAQDEITQHASGLPGVGLRRRPFALIECDETVNPVRAAHHLVDDLGIVAVLGPTNSGRAISVATTVTLPVGALLLTPTATTTSLTALEAQGLVWRTSPSDDLQAKAQVALVAEVEAKLVAATPSLAGNVRLAIVAKGDSYGKGLRDLVVPDVIFNGAHALDQAARFLSIEYPNTDETPGFDFAPVISQLVSFAPSIVMLLGTGEEVTVLTGAEQTLGASAQPPRYLGSDGLLVPSMLALAASDDSLRARYLGTIAGEFDTPTFRSFESRFIAKYGVSPADPKPAATSVDAAYLLALAAVASAGEPRGGASLADGLRAVTTPGGVPFALEPGSINAAFQQLQSGARLKVTGASGPLDYAPGSGDPTVNIDVLSICHVGGQLQFQSTGRYLDATTGILQGTVTTCP